MKLRSHQPAVAGGTTTTADVAKAERPEKVLTFGDVFGRDAGGLIVLLILFGALTLGSDEFLTGDNLANLARQVAVFGIIAVRSEERRVGKECKARRSRAPYKKHKQKRSERHASGQKNTLIG